MFLDERLLDAIELILRKMRAVNEPVIVDRVISGGSINRCYRLKAGRRTFFAKVNGTSGFKNMFAMEAEGLRTIGNTGTIAVPGVIGFGVSAEQQFLLMEWIDPGTRTCKAEYELGRKLAGLHRNSASAFGLDHDNFIGSLPQSNRLTRTWDDFFISERIEPLLKTAIDNGLISRTVVADLSLIAKTLLSRCPIEMPALLHGDLWSGNVMFTAGGEPMLIDPAVYYGHREMDIAMTNLFGGFSDEFYAGYQHEFPLEGGWRDRVDLWNLYPLLVHLNLFGVGYLPQVKTILKRFS
ncbi:MAG TPA: fructosamine kinase family protein [Sphingobacteriaceae bacterium]